MLSFVYGKHFECIKCTILVNRIIADRKFKKKQKQNFPKDLVLSCRGLQHTNILIGQVLTYPFSHDWNLVSVIDGAGVTS